MTTVQPETPPDSPAAASSVEDLIRSIPLDKRFASKLPKGVRREFKALVDAVRARDRAISDDRRF